MTSSCHYVNSTEGEPEPVSASFFLFSVSLLFSFKLIFIIGLVVLDREGRCSPNRVSYGHLIQVPSTSCSPFRICFCSASRTTEGEPAWSAGGRLPNLSSTEGTHTLCQRLFSCSWLPYPFVLFDDIDPLFIIYLMALIFWFDIDFVVSNHNLA